MTASHAADAATDSDATSEAAPVTDTAAANEGPKGTARRKGQTRPRPPITRAGDKKRQDKDTKKKNNQHFFYADVFMLLSYLGAILLYLHYSVNFWCTS